MPKKLPQHPRKRACAECGVWKRASELWKRNFDKLDMLFVSLTPKPFGRGKG